MNKYLNGGIAALVAMASVTAAIPVSAQPWGGDGRSERHQGREGDGDRDGHHGQRDRRDNRHDRRGDWRSDGRGDWNRGDRGWHGQGNSGRHGQDDRRWRYYGGSYGYNGYDGRWRSGQRYPYWRDHSYYIEDYGAYGLPPPRHGYRYYRGDNGDIVMVAIASGIIGLILGGALAGR